MERNTDVVDDDAIRLPVDVPLGDAIIEMEDVFGNGVTEQMSANMRITK